MAAVPTTIAASAPPSLLTKLAQKFSVEPNKMLATLKNTAFKGDVSNEQMMALLIVADQYGLNPWTKEIYAFPDKHNGIVPVVGVDGWSRIINQHAHFDGMEFAEGPEGKDGLPEWIECSIFRKDRGHPTKVKEYMAECKRGPNTPWGTHPRRMLRHKSLIQCARMAFGFVGIFDEDEAQRIVERDITPVAAPAAVAALNAQIAPPAAAVPATVSEEAVFTEPEVVMSYANVANRIERADNVEALSEAMDLIRNVPSPEQQAELNALASKRLTQIQQ